jgi:hypothetical protein
VWVANALTSECLLVEEGGTVVEPGGHLPELLRLHARGEDRRTLFADDRADQHRVGGQHDAIGTDRAVRVDVAGAGLP